MVQFIATLKKIIRFSQFFLTVPFWCEVFPVSFFFSLRCLERFQHMLFKDCSYDNLNVRIDVKVCSLNHADKFYCS